MTHFYVVGRDGTKATRRNWSYFSDLRWDIKDEIDDKLDLAEVILERAKDNPAVHFYDIGCGRGLASRDIFQELRKKAMDYYGDSTLVDRVQYIGIDRQSSNSWEDHHQVKFYEGDVSQILANENMPPIDVGVAHWVLPYIEDKLEALTTIAGALFHQNGIFIGFPFYPHQTQVKSDQDQDCQLCLNQCFPESIKVNQGKDYIIMIKKGIMKTNNLVLIFAGHFTDQHWFEGKGIGGYFGQQVSCYKPALQLNL